MRLADPTIRIPERHKKEGLSYAVTADGLELPVIDVDHPAFKLEAGEVELAALMKETILDRERRARMPPLVRKLMLRIMLRGSILAGLVGGAPGTFMSGIGTYLLKLGPDNLGRACSKKVDRAIAASLPCLSSRYRLRDTAMLLAQSIAGALKTRPDGAIRLFNVAGGPASDSLNALMIIRRGSPELLECRKMGITVLDLSEEGPIFGERSLAALLDSGGALAGLEIGMRSLRYDWGDAPALREPLGIVDLERDVVAISSEGGLFEYGSDADIDANLRVFAELTPPGTAFVGTMSIAEGEARVVNGASGAAIRLRSLEAMAKLAEGAGWRFIGVRACPLSRCFALSR